MPPAPPQCAVRLVQKRCRRCAGCRGAWINRDCKRLIQQTSWRHHDYPAKTGYQHDGDTAEHQAYHCRTRALTLTRSTLVPAVTVNESTHRSTSFSMLPSHTNKVPADTSSSLTMTERPSLD